MLNRITLRGRVGRPPHVGLTQDGKEIAKFPLATSTYWRDETGEWHSATDWHRITVFRNSTIQWIKDVLQKGHMVKVEGKLSYHRWIDKYGQDHSTAHVVVAGKEGSVEYVLSPASASQSSDQNTLLSSSSTAHSDSQGKAASSKPAFSPESEEEDVSFEMSQENTDFPSRAYYSSTHRRNNNEIHE